MKNKLISLAVACALVTGFSVVAVEADGAKSAVEKQACKDGHKKGMKKQGFKHGFKRGHKRGFGGQDTIRDFMLANGDLTQDQIDDQKEQRELMMTEYKALKEAGDKDALSAKRTEFKAKREERKTAMKKYIAEHSELQALLKAERSEMKAKHHKRHGERKARKASEEG